MTHDPHHAAYKVKQTKPEKFTLQPLDAKQLAET
jgi:hypothetical protein